MAQPGARLRVEHFYSAEEVEQAREQQAFTTAQLHLLKQQIDSLRRINLQLRALRHKQLTGEELALARSAPHAGAVGGGQAIGVVGGRKKAVGVAWGSGKGAGRGKRIREETPSQLLDDHTPSERSASSGGEEGELSDYETPEESDEEAAALMAKAALTSPRRQSTRQRRGTAPVLRELSSSSGSSSGESEGEEAGAEGRPRSKAGVGGKQRRRQQQEEEGAAKSPGGADGKQKRASFVVVQEDAAAAGGGQILLPSMRPVPVVWAAGEEALCSVCGDGEDAEGNAVLLCEGRGCQVAVHQQCYGVPKVPKGKWLCDACKAKMDPKAANCACCPVVGGALRKVSVLGRVVPASPAPDGAAYVHVACALWTPEMMFAEPELMRGVQLEHMTAPRAELECALCKQAGGAVVQCDFANCCRSFHVLCGRVAGQLLTFRETDGQPLAFCGMHSKARFERTRTALTEGREALYDEAEGGSAGEEEEGEGGQVRGAAPAAAAEPLTEYEQQRLRNIERNKQVLASIRARE